MTGPASAVCAFPAARCGASFSPAGEWVLRLNVDFFVFSVPCFLLNPLTGIGWRGGRTSERSVAVEGHACLSLRRLSVNDFGLSLSRLLAGDPPPLCFSPPSCFSSLQWQEGAPPPPPLSPLSRCWGAAAGSRAPADGERPHHQGASCLVSVSPCGPRSRRLQALARRSSRRAAPRGPFDFFGVSWGLVRRLARLPFVPWKALRSDGSCLPTASKGNANCPASASLSQRKARRQPRRRVQRIRAKEVRPAGLSLQAAPAAATATAAAAAAAAAGGGGGRAAVDPKGSGGPQEPGVSAAASCKEVTSSKKHLLQKKRELAAGRLPGEAPGGAEGSVVSLSPSSSFCCAASVTSDTNPDKTCSNSSGAVDAARSSSRRRGKRPRDHHNSSKVSARRASSSSARAAAAKGSCGAEGEGPVGAPLQYPAVHACRPRFFFITLSSVKQRAFLTLSLAASRRALCGGPPSHCGAPSAADCWEAANRVETTSTLTIAETDKPSSPASHPAAWPPMLPSAAAVAVAAAPEKTTGDTETSATCEDA
ncbi:hypothetical protein Efla_004224 [Eimeria flavescens]